MKALLISRCLLGDNCRYDGKSKPLPDETLQALRARYDLIPVCPNCHTALHSKKGGVYTIEELKKMKDVLNLRVK